MPNLVGIGLSQVPTNSMLGGLAYQDPEHASIKNLDLKNLSQINSEIADTAVDVFVYDTRKDSDGGAWRKRTQNTSWYNETLGTATRGTRREFPAVAVIVAETTKVTIYDGDDPDLPMWMTFEPNGIIDWSTSNVTKINISALNGILTTVTNDGWHLFKFVEDYVEIIYSSRNYNISSGRTIADRNNSTSYATVSGTALRVYKVVTYDMNDVAMTVLPNAPIDDATGLPIPTIAVATAGGVSVIRDDGNVFDVIDSNGARKCYDVSFTKDHKIMHTGDLGAGGTHAGNVFVTNVLTADRAEYDNHDDLYRWYSTSAMYPRINGGNTFNTRVLDPLDVGDHHYAMADVGISLIEDGTSSSYGNTDGMVAYITSDYNSGYQHGDIKGAFLSDTDTTNVTGAELITNGTFDSNTTGWTAHNSATITHTTPSAASIDSPATDGLATPSSAGIIKIVSNGGASGAYQSFTTVVGKTYTASFIAYQVSYSSNYVKIGTSIGGHQNYDFYNEWDQSVNNNWASGSATFTATATTTYITLWPSQVSGRVLYMDQISVRLANPDRSVNDNGLQVYGTVTKSAVATGAELVGYGPFSSSNYLKQSNNSDLAPGTGAYSVTCWIKTALSGSNDQYIFDRGVGGSNSRNLMLVMQNSGRIQFYHTRADGTSSDLQTTDMPSVADNYWHQVVGLYDGSAYRVYIDGKASSVTNTIGRDVGNDGAPALTIGTRFNITQTFGGSMALFRYSKSAPSAEQIKKMYEDEKCLFHENAKATLYGSSDAVTALAFDDTTNLLHAGTSAGRSEFQGLRRINNTTDAVTTAISASNGLVAEQ